MLSIPATKKHYHHGDLHQQLLSMAAVLIREDGEAALSMRKLAERLGVSRMAPYHHFVDKQALLCGVAQAGFALCMTDVMAATTGHSTADNSTADNSTADHNTADNSATKNDKTAHPFSKTILKQFVCGYVEFAVAHHEYYDLMFGGHLWQSGVITDDFRSAAHAAFKSYVDLIRAWHLQGDIASSLDPLRFAQMSWSTLHGMSRLLIDGIYVEHSAIDTLCNAATDSFWSQIQPTVTKPNTTP